MEGETVTAERLALMLGKTVGTIRYDLSRHPERLPPSFKLPGSRRPLWLMATVRQFIMESAAEQSALPEHVQRSREGRA